MQIRFKIFLCALALCLTGPISRGQAPAQIATKTHTQTITCTPKTTFAIVAEKAAITVTGWSNNYIQVRLSFTAAHPDKKIAQQELGYMKYAISSEEDGIELRNTFALPAATDHIQSKLTVTMEVMVPEKNRLQVSNKYGNISMNRLTGSINVSISFGDLHFNDITGQVTIGADYSDIRGTRINTTMLQCKDEKSKIALDLIGGSYSFTSNHSDVDLSIKAIRALTIRSNRTDITLRPQAVDACRYKITSTNGALYLPEKYASRLIKKGNQQSFTTSGAAALPLLDVTSTFNSVTIK